MRVSESMRRVLGLVEHHGEAVRVFPDNKPWGSHLWVWAIAGVSNSGPVDRLIRAGLIEVQGDRAVLSDRGRRYLVADRRLAA